MSLKSNGAFIRDGRIVQHSAEYAPPPFADPPPPPPVVVPPYDGRFVSYAQNYEDVVLWRALKHIEKGYYVDVGAESPHVGTVTRAFYERGWRGLNIEPIARWFGEIVAARPEDTNFNGVAGTAEGQVELLEVIGTGLSTASIDYAEKHKAELGYDYKKITVPSTRLDTLIQAAQLETIHFLKIDVEGAEKDVLESIDLKLIRPWIILLEATEPNSQKPTHQEWEGILTKNNYKYSYFDGLNRFYIAKEKFDELNSKLSLPPNIFDNFVKA